MSRKFVINCALLLLIVALLFVKTSARDGSVIFLAQTKTRDQLELIMPPLKPVLRVSAQSASASAVLETALSAQGALAMDTATKKILWQKNATTQYYPASTTKIITALVARDLYDLDDLVEITTADLVYGNTVGWYIGEKIPVRDLLQALLIVSANEVGLALANHAPGGYDGFIAAMNTKVERLGLRNTHFVNPQGFDATDQQTSAFDLAIAALELLRDDFLADIVATPTQTVTTASGHSYRLTNTNHLLTRDDLPYKVKGVKTGTTNLANEALVSLLEKDGHEILLVVLSAQNRYNDTIRLADFIFENFVWQQTTLVDSI